MDTVGARRPPIRLGLTLALMRGRHSYVTTVNGIPVAFTKDGWYTQEQIDAKIASRQPPAEETT
jgi:hypothetical protein